MVDINRKDIAEIICCANSCVEDKNEVFFTRCYLKLNEVLELFELFKNKYKEYNIKYDKKFDKDNNEYYCLFFSKNY